LVDFFDVTLSHVKVSIFFQFFFCVNIETALPAWLAIGNHSEQAGFALKKMGFLRKSILF
jgi:hypothetical protein